MIVLKDGQTGAVWGEGIDEDDAWMDACENGMTCDGERVSAEQLREWLAAGQLEWSDDE